MTVRFIQIGDRLVMTWERRNDLGHWEDVQIVFSGEDGQPSDGGLGDGVRVRPGCHGDGDTVTANTFEIELIEPDAVLDVTRVNAVGPMLLTRHLAPALSRPDQSVVAFRQSDGAVVWRGGDFLFPPATGNVSTLTSPACAISSGACWPRLPDAGTAIIMPSADMKAEVELLRERLNSWNYQYYVLDNPTVFNRLGAIQFSGFILQ